MKKKKLIKKIILMSSGVFLGISAIPFTFIPAHFIFNGIDDVLIRYIITTLSMLSISLILFVIYIIYDYLYDIVIDSFIEE